MGELKGSDEKYRAGLELLLFTDVVYGFEGVSGVTGGVTIVGMSTHYYKKFVRLAARWPKDKSKSRERDVAVFIENEVERVFRKERNTLPQDSALCGRRLQSLEQILTSVHHSNYPNSYKSGVFGLNLDRLREANSDDGRRLFGLRDGKKSFFSGLFRWRS